MTKKKQRQEATEKKKGKTANLKMVLRSKKSLLFFLWISKLFTKHPPSEILSLYFEKKTFFKLQFSILIVRHYYTRKDTMTSFTQEL